MSVKWRVIYKCMGKTMAVEYKTSLEAVENSRDIEGYEGVTNCFIKHIDDGTPVQPGPFEIKPPPTRYDVLSK